jgi:hypothetical protein
LRLAALALSLFLIPSLLADQLPDKSDRVVDYRISVKLDAVKKLLDGSERITWRNPSTEPVSDLWFHLYLNAFMNSKSTFFKESGGQLRGDSYEEGKWGWTQIRSIRLADGRDLSRAMRFEQPDDDNVDDRTVLRVLLPEPVPPGESITVNLTFLAQLPQVFARTGYRHDFLLVGQWFPKLGVYEPAGMRGRATGGWNCHQFHASSEFYADYGQFKVDITLPGNYVLGATGVRTAQNRNADGTVTLTYEQDDVHDFAWTASPHFVQLKRTFKASEQVTPREYSETAALLGRSLDEVRLRDVEVTLLLQPAHLPQADRHFQAAMAGIKYFGLWYGRYPYGTLTVVDPGPGAGGAGGMEYPTFITAGTSFVLNRWPFDRVRAPEMVTIHEFGHNFWYGLVGNNEFEEAWLDEGFNSYSTGRVVERAYGLKAGLIEFLGYRISELDSIRGQNSPEQKFNSILSFAWKYTPRGTYGFNSYARPELVLRTLENLLGEKTMARVMRTYHERWRFRHPSSEDFFAVAGEVSGRNLGWYFDQVVRTGDILDYEIGSISSEKVKPDTGIFDLNGKRVELKREEEDKKLREAEKKGAKPLYETVVVVRRRGEVRFPVDIDLKFEGKPAERRHWDGNSRTVTYRVTGPDRLEWANVDPLRKIELDVDWLNNARRINPDRRASSKTTTHWMFFVQNLLAFVGL